MIRIPLYLIKFISYYHKKTILSFRLISKTSYNLNNFYFDKYYGHLIKAKYALMNSCLFKINSHSMKYFNNKHYQNHYHDHYKIWFNLFHKTSTTRCNVLTKKGIRCKNFTKYYLCATHLKSKNNIFYNKSSFLCPPIFNI